ncbi:MAG TPA: tetratricopeptide repeat protein [Myxococcaceae bacterium]|nr:tetratricopeptide repeat protein [Myxococcaceae bacterium]
MDGAGLLVPVLAATALVAVLALLAALSRKRSTEDASRAYLAGVRYVLSDEPDAAIAELSRAAQLNTGTTETYFALAALMRRKGELAWAIRLGQNMLLKPQLQPEVRRRARLELALDYRRAGMQDRARETFEALVADPPVEAEALVAFRRLLEESRDWARAVEVQELLVKEQGSGDDVLAHLLAEQSLVTAPSDSGSARALAGRATSLVPDGAHGLLALAEARLASGDPAGARTAAEQAVAREPETAAQGYALVLEAGAAPEECARWLGELEEPLGERALPVSLVRAEALIRAGRTQDAVGVLEAAVGRTPRSVEARRALGELLLSTGRLDSVRDQYREVLRRLGDPLLAFRCGSCRARFRTFDFRCPGCGAWDALSRERGSSTGEFDPLRSRA